MICGSLSEVGIVIRLIAFNIDTILTVILVQLVNTIIGKVFFFCFLKKEDTVQYYWIFFIKIFII